MDENRVEGTVREYGGKFQEGVGTITGDAASRRCNERRQRALRNSCMGRPLTRLVRPRRHSIPGSATRSKHQPYTTAVVALGIGGLLGRKRRPCNQRSKKYCGCFAQKALAVMSIRAVAAKSGKIDHEKREDPS